MNSNSPSVQIGIKLFVMLNKCSIEITQKIIGCCQLVHFTSQGTQLFL